MQLINFFMNTLDNTRPQLGYCLQVKNDSKDFASLVILIILIIIYIYNNKNNNNSDYDLV
jgi:hypothetical protein